MKFILLQSKFKEGLNIIERICPTRSLTLPILSNVFIKAEKNFINLVSTDLEIGVKWWSLAKIEKEGKIVIPTKLLSSFIGFLPENKIDAELKNKTLFIKSGNHQTQIKGFDPEEFPIVPEIKEGKSVLLNIHSFCQGLTQVVDIPVVSTARPEIAGVYFCFQGDLLKIVATDSFRLAEKKINLNKKVDRDILFILPQRTVREIINIFSEKKGEFQLVFSPNQVLFELEAVKHQGPKIQLLSRLIEGEYPDYEEILPQKRETEVILDRNEFLKQLKIASLFSGRINEVKLTITKDKVEVFSQNPETGEYKSSLKANITGKEVKTSFNYKFLIDGILKIRSSKLIFELNGEEGPGLLKPLSDQSYIYVVMPIKAS